MVIEMSRMNRAGGTLAIVVVLLLLAAAAAGAQTREEAVLWTSIQKSTDPGDFQGYIDTYPNGVFVAVAKRRIETLRWQAIETSTRESDFAAYLEMYPDGAFTASARRRLESIRASRVVSRAAQLRYEVGHVHSWTYTCEGHLEVSDGALTYVGTEHTLTISRPELRRVAVNKNGSLRVNTTSGNFTFWLPRQPDPKPKNYAYMKLSEILDVLTEQWRLVGAGDTRVPAR